MIGISVPTRMQRGILAGKACRWMIVPLICLCLLGAVTSVRAQIWDMDPPLPNSDPQWNKVKTLWANRSGGANLAELIAILDPLRDKYPDKVEPYLWLARVHYLHARYHRKNRDNHFEQSEKFAAQACKMDPDNPLALRILVDTLCYYRNRAYIFNSYGALIRSNAPLTTGEALPEMKSYPDWDAFRQLWAARADIEKAKTAAAMVEKMAQEHPAEGLAQIWAARTNYYIGEYYTSIGEHNAKAIPFYKQGMAYAEKGRKLQPNSVPANYWYQINLARSIQFTSLLNKGRHLMDLLNPLLFCSRENSTYYFFGPILTLGTMITNAGWVTEKGMKIAHVTLEMDMNSLEIAEILLPDYYYIPYTRADIMAYKGKKKEALAILEKLLARNPDVSPMIPENRSFQRMAKTLYLDIQQGRR